MRRLLESFLIGFKEDLKLADACNQARDSLMTQLRRQDLFLPEFTSYFKTEEPLPYSITEDEPSQVVTLKKILNALHHAEQGLRGLESIDLSTERYTAGIGRDVLTTSYKTIHELFAAIQLTNHSTAEVQELLAPHVQTLLPKLSQAADSIQAFRPEDPEKMARETLVKAVQWLPEQKQAEDSGLERLTAQLFRLPEYFEQLTQTLRTEAKVPKSALTLDEIERQQQLILQKTKEASRELADISKAKSLFTAFPAMRRMVVLLAGETETLLRKAQPLTKQAYDEAVKKLNELRHDLLPNIISQAERLEESLGLQPSVLSEPLQHHLAAYYETLASKVNWLFAEQVGPYMDNAEDAVNAAGYLAPLSKWRAAHKPRPDDSSKKLTPVAGLEIMRDDEFVAQLRESRTTRQVEAEFAARDKEQALDAANQFFDYLQTFRAPYQAWCKWSLANLYPEDKNKLLQDYKRFQHHFAAIHPDIDKLIVDALTHANEGTYLARVSNTEYKQLWGQNHFTQVLACRGDVITHLQQALAQDHFNAQKTASAFELHEQRLYQEQGERTTLREDVPPYDMLEMQIKTDESYEFYHENRLPIAVELKKLQEARKGFEAFIMQIVKTRPEQDFQLKELTEEEKEPIRRAYQKFQSYVARIDPDLNQRLVQILNPGESEDALDITDITHRVGNITEQLENWINTYEAQLADYNMMADKAKSEELERAPVVSLGQEIEKKTLLGQISKLKLSQSVGAFVEHRFKPFLKTNLDTAVLNALKLDEMQLPFSDLYQDAAQVALYKKLLNSFYYLQRGLEQVESAHDFGDPQYLANRTRYISQVLKPLLRDFVNTYSHLSQTSQTPGLNAILNEGMQLFTPLQAIPFIGDYLKSLSTTPKAEQELDVVAAWKAQQKIVARAIGTSTSEFEEDDRTTSKPQLEEDPKPTTLAEPSSPTVDPTNNLQAEEESKDKTLQRIATELYRIPVRLQMLNPQRKQEHLVADEKIKQQADELMQRLKAFPIKLQTLQNILHSVNRINTQLSSIGVESRQLIFSRLADLRDQFGAELIGVTDKAEFHLGLRPGALSQPFQERFDRFYRSFITDLLPNQDSSVLKLMSRIPMTERRLERERDRLAQVEKSDAPHEFRTRLVSAFTHMQNASYRLSSFENEDEQRAFLQDYQNLQPYLMQIDEQFDLSSFLRELREPIDFKHAYRKIMNQQEKLMTLVSAKEEEKSLQISQCQNRIQYLESQLHQDKQSIEEEVEAYKSAFFAHHVKSVRSQLQMQLGDYTDPVFDQITASLKANKAEILEGLTHEDEIESLIAKRVDQFIQRHHEPLITISKKLLESERELQNQIVMLKAFPKNPVSDELLAHLQQARDRLFEKRSFTEQFSMETLREEHQKVQQILDGVSDYHKLQKLHRIFSEMEDYIHRHPDPKQDVNQEKLEEIEQLRSMLYKKSESPQSRMQSLSARVNTEACESIFLKNSDSKIKKFFTWIKKVLGITKDKTLGERYRHFKDEINHLKNEHRRPESAPEKAVSSESADREAEPAVKSSKLT